jgi:hypothetical protein
MTIAITARPASGEGPEGGFCHFTLTGAATNDEGTYDDEAYPSRAAITYRLEARKSGEDTLRSHEFSVNADGEGTWDGVRFPSAGTWTIAAVNQQTEADDATLTYVPEED